MLEQENILNISLPVITAKWPLSGTQTRMRGGRPIHQTTMNSSQSKNIGHYLVERKKENKKG